jgi:hypothetical protein
MVIVALLAAAAAGAPLPPPIEPAGEGRMQCAAPDVTRKVCGTLTGYVRRPDGGIETTATVLLDRDPLVIMTTISDATIAQGRVCGAMSKAVIAAARFTMAGAEVDDAKAAMLRAAVTRAYGEIVDHTMCTSFLPDGSGFSAHTAVDGLPRPGLDRRVIWVNPADGWKVGP